MSWYGTVPTYVPGYLGRRENMSSPRSTVSRVKAYQRDPPTHTKTPCCGSGMFIPDPDFTHLGSRIPDPKTATKERGEKNYFIFEML